MADSPKPPPDKPELPSPTSPAGAHEEDAARWADGRQFTRDEIVKLKESTEERPRESFTDGDRDFPLPHENRSWITGAKRKSVWFEFGPGSLPSEMRKSEESSESPAQPAESSKPPEPEKPAPIDWTSTRKRKTPTDDDKTPLERFLELQKNAPPESDEDRRRRQDEELQSRKESLQRRREFERMHGDHSGDKPNQPPIDKPWHKRPDLLVGILLGCGVRSWE